MPRWTAAQKLRAEVRRIIGGIKSDAHSIKRQKLDCEVCLSKGVLMCLGGKHVLCDSCLLTNECGCGK